jgi:hypothetical protein
MVDKRDSIEEAKISGYERLNREKCGFWAAYQKLLQEVDLEELDIDPQEIFAGVRDPSPGRPDEDWQ